MKSPEKTVSNKINFVLHVLVEKEKKERKGVMRLTRFDLLIRNEG